MTILEYFKNNLKEAPSILNNIFDREKMLKIAGAVVLYNFFTKTERLSKIATTNIPMMVYKFFRGIKFFCKNFWKILTDNSRNTNIYKKCGKISYELVKYIPYFLSFFIGILSKSIICSFCIYFGEKKIVPERFWIKSVEFLLPNILLKETNLSSNILKYRQFAVSAVICLIAMNISDIIIKPLYRIFPNKKDMLHYQALTREEVEAEAIIGGKLKKVEIIKQKFEDAHSRIPSDNNNNDNIPPCSLKQIKEQFLDVSQSNIKLPKKL